MCLSASGTAVDICAAGDVEVTCSDDRQRAHNHIKHSCAGFCTALHHKDVQKGISTIFSKIGIIIVAHRIKKYFFGVTKGFTKSFYIIEGYMTKYRLRSLSRT